jgi:hypothetical protein
MPLEGIHIGTPFRLFGGQSNRPPIELVAVPAVYKFLFDFYCKTSNWASPYREGSQPVGATAFYRTRRE